MNALNRVFENITDKYRGFGYGNIPNIDMNDRIALVRAIHHQFKRITDQKIVNYALSNNMTIDYAYSVFNSPAVTVWQCQMINRVYDDLDHLIQDEFRDYLSREDFRENACDPEASWWSSNDSEFAQEKMLDDRDRARDMNSTLQLAH
jgi:hypothetical protein